jgi:hypothetical protein
MTIRPFTAEQYCPEYGIKIFITGRYGACSNNIPSVRHRPCMPNLFTCQRFRAVKYKIKLYFVPSPKRKHVCALCTDTRSRNVVPTGRRDPSKCHHDDRTGYMQTGIKLVPKIFDYGS